MVAGLLKLIKDDTFQGLLSFGYIKTIQRNYQNRFLGNSQRFQE